jgi:cytochrome c-type biogenesis protein CcsB
MAARRNRSLLLPVVVGLAALTAFNNAFIPGPAGLGKKSSSAVLGDSGSYAAPMSGAAAVSVLTALGLPAHAVVDSPLAHGAPGLEEGSLVQEFAEKGAFGGLLVSTVLAWWRGTLGQGSVQESSNKPPAFFALAFACLSLVVLLSARWIESGHFPLSNMYESLMFLAWGVTAVTIAFIASQSQETPEKKTFAAAGVLDSKKAKQATADIAAVWASPVALATVAFATLSLPKVLQKSSALVPALQSNWLVMHVSVVMCSYATLLFGSLLCMAVLALSQPKDSPITAIRTAVMPALQGIANNLQPQPAVALSGQIPVETSAMTATATFNAGNTASSPQVVTTSRSGSSAFTVEFSQSSTGSATLSEDEQLALTLDDLAYRACLLGFGFLTIGIVSGAVWANEAWGNYWSWDPKETWALIAWLVYAGYLHTRLQLGWDTRDSAKIGAFGFLVIWVCYIGVNLMGIGLHSYGFFLK